MVHKLDGFHFGRYLASLCSGNMKSGVVWILNGQKKVGLRMGSKIWKPNYLKFVQMAAILSKSSTKASGFQMVGTRAISIAKATLFEN